MTLSRLFKAKAVSPDAARTWLERHYALPAQALSGEADRRVLNEYRDARFFRGVIRGAAAISFLSAAAIGGVAVTDSITNTGSVPETLRPVVEYLKTPAWEGRPDGASNGFAIYAFHLNPMWMVSSLVAAIMYAHYRDMRAGMRRDYGAPKPGV